MPNLNIGHGRLGWELSAAAMWKQVNVIWLTVKIALKLCTVYFRLFKVIEYSLLLMLQRYSYGNLDSRNTRVGDRDDRGRGT